MVEIIPASVTRWAGYRFFRAFLLPTALLALLVEELIFHFWILCGRQNFPIRDDKPFMLRFSASAAQAFGFIPDMAFEEAEDLLAIYYQRGYPLDNDCNSNPCKKEYVKTDHPGIPPPVR
ncbi:hypothetical protein LJC63_04155 [Ruminococcaceae bacterium OttesenSCG-928-L11]|nr:hypothetical protein [Ruminococcaceae bacterium OttesenSCG-928-L11]